MSATILPFPRRPAAPDADGSDRLAKALGSLHDALAAQRAAVAAWQTSLADLRGTVGGLGESLGRYAGRLETLAQDVGGVNRQARALDAWADGVIAPR